ncbi:D-arabinono-1,4-lactone oxidase-domain-containing protein [Coprinopsis sp. MPI-PUGE-AT-0042]|nr:D-arabinono-1,4-lactone oxidase-domain-containing protein [Coprinopsis sp. MPI-PUGE-AT-0042]
MASVAAPTALLSASTQDLYKALEPITVPSDSPRSRFTNWGLSFTCKPLAVFEPENDSQCELVLELARREGKVVRAVGVGHSPSDLACTSGFMLRVTKMNRVLEVNAEKGYIVAEAGITLHALHEELGKHSLAMRNLGSISDQTLGGIITTATHGSGIDHKVLSTHVQSLTLLIADGSRVSCSRDENSDLFTATLCGLGSTGIILTVQLEVEPAFRLKEEQESIPFDQFISNFDQLTRAAEFSRFWWFPAADTVRCSLSNRTLEPANPGQLNWAHWVLGHHLVQFMLFLGRWFQSLNPMICRFVCWMGREKSIGVDDSHRIFNIDCLFPQHTTEWAIPLQNSRPFLRELRSWLMQQHIDPNGVRPHFPVEIRFSATDDIWLSPSNGQTMCWVGVVQYRPYGFNVQYRRLFDYFECLAAKYEGRPHWAKAHKLRPHELRKLYPRFDDFLHVLETVDPNGLFRNEYVQRHLLGQPVDSRVFKERKQ